ncbi:Centromere/kinetochore Zw10-domain-containing protein, partial [Radiomyces spectabilis]|uniref:Centromere/kinetochore Zw10-domain-containing protein n=1 Tax=Radiomyces spectabilis TaxID=64574 RepID=UPI0022201F00
MRYTPANQIRNCSVVDRNPAILFSADRLDVIQFSLLMASVGSLAASFKEKILNDNDSNPDISLLKSQLCDAPSLSAVLDTLNESFDDLSRQLFREILENFDVFESSYQKDMELHARIVDAVKDVNSIHATVSDPAQGVNTTAANALQEYQSVLDQSSENQQIIDMLQTLTTILQDIDRVKDQLGKHSLLDATLLFLRIQSTVHDLCESQQPCDWRQVDAFQFIQQELDRLKMQLLQTLEDGMNQAIVFHIKDNINSMVVYPSVQLGSTADPVVLIQIFQCFSELQQLSVQMAHLKRSIFKHIVSPFYENLRHATIETRPYKGNTAEGGQLELTIGSASSPDDIEQGPSVIDQSIDVLHQTESMLQFFYTYIFNNSSETPQLTHLFGNLILPEIFETYIQKCLAPSVPSSARDLEKFGKIAQAVTQFEEKCDHAFHLYTAESDETSKASLTAYVAHIDRHFAVKRRHKVLQQGRQVMMRKLYDTEKAQERHNDQCQTYCITQTPHLLSMLLADTVTEAASLQSSHPISATKLIEVTQELTDLYRAITPSFHRSYFLSNPAHALVFRNDCFWLAHQIVEKLAVQKETRQFEGLTTMFANTARALRDLGNSWYQVAITQRMQVIHAFLDKLEGFTTIGEGRQQEQTCHQAIMGAVEQAQSYAHATRSVLDPSLFLNMMGFIVDGILERMIKELEDLTDIGAQESHLIASLLNSLAQLVNGFDLPGRDASEPTVIGLVPHWKKFWLLKDMLEMNLRDIMDHFRRGDLELFDKQELVRLICALFADTQVREASIQEIESGHPVPTAPSLQMSPEPRSSTLFPHTPVQHQPSPPITHTPSGTRSMVNSPSTTSLNSDYAKPKSISLEYNVDDTAEMDNGWDDADEDIFIDNIEPAPTGPPEVKPMAKASAPGSATEASSKAALDSTSTSSSKSTATQLAMGEMDIDESGWDDEDIDTSAWDNIEDEGNGWDEAEEDLFQDNTKSSST